MLLCHILYLFLNKVLCQSLSPPFLLFTCYITYSAPLRAQIFTSGIYYTQTKITGPIAGLSQEIYGPWNIFWVKGEMWTVDDTNGILSFKITVTKRGRSVCFLQYLKLSFLPTSIMFLNKLRLHN